MDEKSLALQIFELLQTRGHAMTSMEIAAAMGVSVSAASSRCFDLRKMGYASSSIRPGGKKTLMWLVVPGKTGPKSRTTPKAALANFTRKDEPVFVPSGPSSRMYLMAYATRHSSTDCIGSARHRGIGSSLQAEHGIAR